MIDFIYKFYILTFFHFFKLFNKLIKKIYFIILPNNNIKKTKK